MKLRKTYFIQAFFSTHDKGTIAADKELRKLLHPTTEGRNFTTGISDLTWEFPIRQRKAAYAFMVTLAKYEPLSFSLTILDF